MMDKREKEIREIVSLPKLRKYRYLPYEEVSYLLTLIDSLRAEKKEIQDAIYKATRADSSYEDLCELEKVINKDRIPTTREAYLDDVAEEK